MLAASGGILALVVFLATLLVVSPYDPIVFSVLRISGCCVLVAGNTPVNQLRSRSISKVITARRSLLLSLIVANGDNPRQSLSASCTPASLCSC